jgi:uncharacterized protein
MNEKLTSDEKITLLRLARQSIELAVRHLPIPTIDLNQFPAQLQKDGAAFVTLTKEGELRGCIGALAPYQPLAQDVIEHAIAAALEDYRFPPVQEDELSQISIEISRLTAPLLLEYSTEDQLLDHLRPNVDGVILRDGFRRATFLPQVWEKIPDKGTFLANLCYKMGASPNLWRKKHLDILTYQVEDFHE